MLSLFRNTADAAPSALEIAHDGAVYRIALRRSATSRRYTLRLRAASRDVLLTIPQRGTVKAARAFAERHAGWIGARLSRLPAPVPFDPGAVVPLRGEPHRITHRPEARGVVWIERDEEGARIVVTGEAAHVARRVADFLKREARRDLTAAALRYAAEIGLKPRRITLRDTASRWGSCTSAGALNFSWRLILAPSFVLDYLAAHEVAHMSHMNHSPQYWALARQLFPDLDRAEAWLKAHASGLHRYGAGAIASSAPN